MSDRTRTPVTNVDEEISATSPKSPITSPAWQWPTCNCSEEELRRLLPDASGNAQRPALRREVADPALSILMPAERRWSYGAVSSPPLLELTDAELEEQAQSSEELVCGDFGSRSARNTALWKLSTFALLIIALVEGVWLFQTSCTCSHSYQEASHAQRYERDMLWGPSSRTVGWGGASRTEGADQICREIFDIGETP